MTITVRPHVPAPPTSLTDLKSHAIWSRKLFDAIKAWRVGKFDCTKSVTLTIGAASTTVSDYRFSPQSFVWGMPTTANASAEIGAGTIYFTPTDGSCLIMHANNANADRTFTLVILG